MNTHPLHGLHWSARFSALQRQAVALLPALLAGGVAAGGFGAALNTALLCAWLAYCGSYLGLVAHLAWRLNAADTHRRARWEDPGAAMLFVLVTLAACASLVSVGMALQTGSQLAPWARAAHLLLIALSLAGAWLLIQVVFALHYARRYYLPGLADCEPARGLDFPGGQAPDYLDFFYFSAVVGMTSQVSDVAVRSRAMRRLTLVHGLLSFAFNLIVLALAVNAMAASLGR
jgi:uncharacterized membrane protein